MNASKQLVFLHRWWLCLGCLSVSLWAAGCTSDAPRPTDPENIACTTPTDPAAVKFSMEVKSVFERNCKDCHSTGGIASSVFVYETYSAVKGRVDNGKLLSAIRRDNLLVRPMPDGRAPISTCDRRTIEDWITAGAKDN
jgi:hypothetical protein